MAKLKKNTVPVKSESAFLPIIQSLVALAAILIGVILPLYLKDGYSKISVGKYEFYVNFTLPAFGLILLLIVIMSVVNYKEFKGKSIKELVSVLDWLVLAYIAFVFASFILCDYKEQAVWGYSGWNMGLYSQITFVILYFLLSRYGKYYKSILFVFCMAAFVAISIGVLHRFMIDPIHVYDGIDDYYKLLFLSTLGQASWYSSYLCTLLPLGIWAFLCFDKRWIRIVSGIFTFIGFASLCTQNSDSAYIALAIFLMVYFWFALKSYKGIERFLEILIIFFAAVKFMFFGFQIFPNQSEQYDVLSRFLLNSRIVWGVLLVLLVIRLGILFFKRKYGYKEKPIKIVRNVIYILAGVFLGLMILCLTLSIFGYTPKALEGIVAKVPYLKWGQDWGNGRGFTWSFSASMFRDMDMRYKFFGVGPDCFDKYAYAYNAQSLGFWGDKVLTNAHNEWFTAIINFGVLGGGVYLAIFITGVVRFLKRASWEIRNDITSNPSILLGMAACILTYVGHNLFCYQQILCTPFVFMFLGIGEYYIRMKEIGKLPKV